MKRLPYGPARQATPVIIPLFLGGPVCKWAGVFTIKPSAVTVWKWYAPIITVAFLALILYIITAIVYNALLEKNR